MPSASLGHSGGVGSSRTINRLKGLVNSVDWLGREMLEMRIRDNKLDVDDEKDIEPDILDGIYERPGHIIVTTHGGRNGQPKQTISYIEKEKVGSGANGLVYKAKCRETRQIFAIKKVEIKKVEDDKKQELQILPMLDHPNIVALEHCFCTTTDKGKRSLHLVLEYVPKTLDCIAKGYNRSNKIMPLIFVKLYIYQICRSLAYIHRSFNICHRDIHPENLLVNPDTHQLKLCDFGNAAVLVEGDRKIIYGYYDAPEEVYKASKRPSAIDLWSTGCLMAGLLLGEPLPWKASRADLLVEYMKTYQRGNGMTKTNYTEPKFPQMKSHAGNETYQRGNCKARNFTAPKVLKSHPGNKVFPKGLPAQAVDLVSKLLEYPPERRCTALDACLHPFFDDLRHPDTLLPEGRPLPPLFDLTDKERAGIPPDTLKRLIPRHARKQNGTLKSLIPRHARKQNGPTHESQG